MKMITPISDSIFKKLNEEELLLINELYLDMVKYKNVIDKIREIINNNAFFDPAMPNCMALGQKSTLEIKELLEEVE